MTTSLEWGDFKSEVGRLEVTQPTPKTLTTDSPLPSVGSSGAPPESEDGRKDSQARDIRTQKKQARAVPRTPGVDLLLGLGNERSELLLTGKVLQDQARTVDGLLMGNWPRELILTALLRPLPEDTRSVGAVIARRLQDLVATPVPRHMPMPAPRNTETADGYWERYEETKRASGWQSDSLMPGEDVAHLVLRRTAFPDCKECRDPITTPTGTVLCVKCAGWPQCPLCCKYVQPGSACEYCEVRPGEVEFEVCEVHGDRFIKGTACFQCIASR